MSYHESIWVIMFHPVHHTIIQTVQLGVWIWLSTRFW